MEFLGWVDAESGVDCGVKIPQGYYVFDRLLGEIVGNPIGSLVLETSTGKKKTEAF
jgi:hypothetical protein